MHCGPPPVYICLHGLCEGRGCFCTQCFLHGAGSPVWGHTQSRYEEVYKYVIGAVVVWEGAHVFYKASRGRSSARMCHCLVTVLSFRPPGPPGPVGGISLTLSAPYSVHCRIPPRNHWNNDDNTQTTNKPIFIYFLIFFSC